MQLEDIHLNTDCWDCYLNWGFTLTLVKWQENNSSTKIFIKLKGF